MTKIEYVVIFVIATVLVAMAVHAVQVGNEKARVEEHIRNAPAEEVTIVKVVEDDGAWRYGKRGATTIEFKDGTRTVVAGQLGKEGDTFMHKRVP